MIRRVFAPVRQLFFGALLTTALIAYLLGATAVFIPLVLLVLVLGLHFTRSVDSILSRVIVSLFCLYSIIQIATVLQLFLLPELGFPALAALTCLLTLLLVMVLPEGTQVGLPLKLVSGNDLMAALACAVFVIPLTLILVGSGESMARLGSIQGVDGVNHYAYIAETGDAERLTYAEGEYYPKSFHLSTAFIQESMGIYQGGLGWRAGIRLFVGQYVIFGSLLLYSLYFLTLSLSRRFYRLRKGETVYKVVIALSLGMTITAFYNLPFIYHGFLSYFYIIAAMVWSIFYLVDTPVEEPAIPVSLDYRYKTPGLFLLLGFGASASWPLLSPVFLATAALFLFTTVPSLSSVLTDWRKSYVIVLLAAMQLVPMVLQLLYADSNAAQGINLTGGLRVFHVALLAGGTVLLGVVAVAKNLDQQIRQTIQHVFAPLLVIIVIMAFTHYFLFVEVRYYAIKTAFLFEILLICLATALIVSLCAKQYKARRWQSVYSVPVLVFVAVFSLIAVTGNPLIETRQLFRELSGEPEPAYFENDVKELDALGLDGKIISANVLSMHMSDNDKLFTHIQAFRWANSMTYTGNERDFEALACNGKIYDNLFQQNFSNEAQSKLTSQIRSCAQRSRAQGQTYYIITDDQSEPRLQMLFGDVAEIL